MILTEKLSLIQMQEISVTILLCSNEIGFKWFMRIDLQCYYLRMIIDAPLLQSGLVCFPGWNRLQKIENPTTWKNYAVPRAAQLRALLSKMTDHFRQPKKQEEEGRQSCCHLLPLPLVGSAGSCVSFLKINQNFATIRTNRVHNRGIIYQSGANLSNQSL